MTTQKPIDEGIVREGIIRWFGDIIFPQKLKTMVEKFGEDAIIECANEGILQRSESRIGANPTMLSKPSGYIELSNKGWNIYESLNHTPNEH